MSFMDKLKETLNEEFNVSVTENGALGYRTSGKELLDINFMVSSMRNETKEKVEKRFAKVLLENKLLAVKWLFYVADVRGGVGERRLFRICMLFLANNEPEIAKKLIPLIPEYTRWDNLLVLLDSKNTEIKSYVIDFISATLAEDIKNLKNKGSVSLCAKWMPSANASSNETKRYAKILINGLKTNERSYRKTLSALRSYIDVVEIKMSSKQWNKIKYSAVPSKANLIYNNAFLRNDEERRREYLESLKKGETKINASTLFPHDIVHRYSSSSWTRHLNPLDTTLEELWKNLPDYVKDNSNTICVADGSGSMTSTIGNTRISCLSVANALAIYFSERCSGCFKDKYITFSEHPKLVDFSNCSTLRDKIQMALRHSEIANTNIEATFDLLLTTAVKNNLNQEDMPQNILILSDMEFDGATSGNPNKKLFREIANKYAEHGYKLPRLVFWNICNRSGTIPIRENELGVALVGGFSPAIVNMVLSNSTDPLECLLEQLNSERYKPVEEAIISCLA